MTIQSARQSSATTLALAAQRPDPHTPGAAPAVRNRKNNIGIRSLASLLRNGIVYDEGAVKIIENRCFYFSETVFACRYRRVCASRCRRCIIIIGGRKYNCNFVPFVSPLQKDYTSRCGVNKCWSVINGIQIALTSPLRFAAPHAGMDWLLRFRCVI